MHLRRPAAIAAAVLIALPVAACGRKATPTSNGASGNGSGGAGGGASAQQKPTTPAASGTTGAVTWATYREVQTLDPIQAFDYPENTVITSMCDSLLQQQPDGSSQPGLATKVDQPDPTTIVLTINTSAKFWDGKAVSSADVVYSLRRNTNKALAGFYGAVFENVASISAGGADKVTIKLSKPDNWLLGELSQMPGIVLEKAYVERKGKSFGTPSGGTMCTGAFKLDSWKPGTSLTAVKNDGWWGSPKPQAQSMVFKGVPDDSSLTTGLLTNEITGTYPQPLTTLDQLKASQKVKVYAGPSFASDALVISDLKGTLKDVKVRQALSMAIDRQAYINTLYKGYATMPRTLANPGTWGYEKDVFQADWDNLPEPKMNVAKAKQLIQQAHAAGQEIVIGTSSEINSLETAANAVRQAAISIGLKARLKSVSAANYINFFTDPKAREGVDGFLTVNYPDYADPAALYNTVVMPDGSQNYDGFSDPRITAAMNEARTTTDQKKRAQMTAKAGDLIMQTLPWIPLADPDTVVIMDSRVTGAPSSFQYMGGPWAASIGAAK
jgi:peptide/nickel transport system substrate-binding protein